MIKTIFCQDHVEINVPGYETIRLSYKQWDSAVGNRTGTFPKEKLKKYLIPIKKDEQPKK